jgi:subtilisin family serine protease
VRLLPLALLIAASAAAQPLVTRSTMCQATGPDSGAIVTRSLVGCGEGFPDNLMWHLDRSDSISGTLDGRVTQRTTGRGAVIYVMDTGVRRDHDEFVRPGGSNIIAGIYVASSTKPGTACPDPALQPCYSSDVNRQIFGHGSGVASVAAGRHAGVAPDASLVAVLIQGTEPEWVDALKAVIAHAWSPGAPRFRTAIINISGGVAVGSSSPVFEALMLRMIGGVDANGDADPNGKRFLFVTAAGNSSSDSRVTQCGTDGKSRIYPATRATAIAGLVSVGGLTSENKAWDGACSGAEVLAPAAEMMVADINGRTEYRWKPAVTISGTSFSTPYVSGMAARLLEDHPDATPEDLELMLKASPSRVDGVAVPVAPVIVKRRPAN